LGQAQKCGRVKWIRWFLVYLRNKSWKPECILSFNIGWQILVFYPEPEARVNMGWWILVFYPEPEARD
jgi:hypothetical protein